MLQYFSDNKRHLVCLPYSIENLHLMAKDLNIKICWFHSKKNFSHYDIPKKRIEEIQSKTQIVSPKDIINICKGNFK